MHSYFLFFFDCGSPLQSTVTAVNPSCLQLLQTLQRHLSVYRGLACDISFESFLIEYLFNSHLSVFTSHYSNCARKVSILVPSVCASTNTFLFSATPPSHRRLTHISPVRGMCPHFLFSFFRLPHSIPHLLYLGVTVSECIWS